MAIVAIDNSWHQGDDLIFEDDGPLYKGAATHAFDIRSRSCNAFIGTVKWSGPWRQFCFFAANEQTTLPNRYLTEIVEFCKMKTDARKSMR